MEILIIGGAVAAVWTATKLAHRMDEFFLIAAYLFACLAFFVYCIFMYDHLVMSGERDKLKNKSNRGVAKPGIALGLGPRDRRSESCHPDHSFNPCDTEGMKHLLVVLFLASLANAGVVRVATYPVRHPVKTVTKTVHVATYPVVHPVKAAKGLWWFVW